MSFMIVMTVLHCSDSRRIGSLILGIRSSCYLKPSRDRMVSSITAGFINLFSFLNNLFPCSNSLFSCLDIDLTDCILRGCGWSSRREKVNGEGTGGGNTPENSGGNSGEEDKPRPLAPGEQTGGGLIGDDPSRAAAKEQEMQNEKGASEAADVEEMANEVAKEKEYIAREKNANRILDEIQEDERERDIDREDGHHEDANNWQEEMDKLMEMLNNLFF